MNKCMMRTEVRLKSPYPVRNPEFIFFSVHCGRIPFMKMPIQSAKYIYYIEPLANDEIMFVSVSMCRMSLPWQNDGHQLSHHQCM